MPLPDLRYNAYNYIFTITFKGNYTVKEKFQLIDRLKGFFSRGRLIYTVEYHKKADKQTNNVCAPHIHGLLSCKRQIGKGKYENIQRNLLETYGRSQFFLQECKDEIDGWLEYCWKDVDMNDKNYEYNHSRIIDIDQENEDHCAKFVKKMMMINMN